MPGLLDADGFPSQESSENHQIESDTAVTGLSNLGYIVKSVKDDWREWKELYPDLDSLNNLRTSGGAHPGRSDKGKLSDARQWTYNIFTRAEQIRQVEKRRKA